MSIERYWIKMLKNLMFTNKRFIGYYNVRVSNYWSTVAAQLKAVKVL